MICIVCKNDTIKSIILKDQKVYKYGKLTLEFNLEANILNVFNGKETLSIIPGQQKAMIIDDINYTICIPLFERKFNQFEYYQLNNVVSIGNSIDDDIYIQTISQDRIACFIEDNMLIPKTKGIYVDNKQINNSVIITNKSIQIENCRLIVSNTFIMINKVDNLYSTLQPSPSMPILSKNVYPVQIPLVYKYHHYFEPKIGKLSMDKVPLKRNVLLNSNLISIGPMLMMSMASIASGSIIAFNSYNQGRAVIEILPSLIIPVTMIISCLLFNPLQRILSKKQANIEYINSLADYYIEASRRIKEFNYSCKNKEAYILKQYIMADEINKCLKDNSLLWTKNETHGDFMCLFIGYYTKQLRIDENQVGDDYIDTLLTNYSEIEKAPLIVNLFKQRHLDITNDEDDIVFDYLLVQLCVYSDIQSYRLVLFTNESYLNKNFLLKVMPHFGDDFIASTSDEAIKLNEVLKSIDKPIICFINNSELSKHLDKNWILISNNHCINADLIDCLIEMEGFIGKLTINGQPQIYFSNHHLMQIDLNKLAYELSLYSNVNQVINQVSLELLDYYDPEKVSDNWQKNQYSSMLPITLGLDENQKPIVLDIASNVQGPHGLLAGTTGSGKSELLLTMILALASLYPSTLIQIVIIDFKGGDLVSKCTYNQQRLPHILQSITNLDSQSIDRAIISLKRECEYRQQRFIMLSNKVNTPINNINEYINHFKIRNEECDLAHLLIIVDEFAQVKDEAPDFMEQIVAIARVGRSLGIHLLLATQRPQGIINEQIKANTHFRISLHVNDKQDSLDIVDNAIAASFSRPGQFALRCDETLACGQAIYSQSEVKQQKCKVKILDKHLKLKQNSITSIKAKQHSQLIEVITQLDKNHNKRTLWLEPLNDQIKYHNNHDQIYLGISDDYHHRQYNDIWLNNENLIVYSDNYNDCLQYLKSIAKQVINNISQLKMEMLILTSNLKSYENLSNYQHIIAIIDMYDEKGNEALFDFIKSHKERHLLFIVDDLSYFNQLNDNNKLKIQRIVDILSSHHINIIVGTNNLQSIPQNLMNNAIKIMLGCCQNDICISLFGQKTIYQQLNQSEALIKEDSNIHKISLFQETSINNYHELPEFNKHKLLLLPERINGIGLPVNTIGVDEKSLDPVIIDEHYVVVSHYQEYLDTFKNHFNDVKGVTYILAKDFKTLYSINKVLWIGPGYTHQFVLQSKEKDCEDNEAILHHTYKVRRVKLIDGIYPYFD